MENKRSCVYVRLSKLYFRLKGTKYIHFRDRSTSSEATAVARVDVRDTLMDEISWNYYGN